MDTKIKAIIFDMDGVIVDSEPLWIEAEIMAFNRFGINIEPWMCKKTKGMRIDQVVSYWLNYFNITNPKKIKESLICAIQEKIISLINQKAKPIRGVLDLINYIISKNYKLALASSSNSAIISAVLTKLNLTKIFQISLSAEQLPYGKPNPQVFINTAKKLKVEPETCLIIEDSFHGIVAGIAAMMKVIAFSNNENPDLAHFKIADYQVNKLIKIKTLL